MEESPAVSSSVLQTGAAAPIFKRKKRGASARPRPLGRLDSASPGPQSDANDAQDEDSEAASHTLEELLALRKLMKASQKEGIDSAKLMAVEAKKKGKQKAKADDAQTVVAAAEEEDEPEDEAAKTRRMVQSNNFTHQSNTLDVDKHMMAYIEEELKKKREQAGEAETLEDGQVKKIDPREEIWNIAEEFKLKRKAVDEGSVTLSTTMLTAIPEVDLGIDNRLKNIEETEKAKMALYEARRKKKREEEEEEELFAAARFYRPRRQVQSDAEALHLARMEAGGEDPSQLDRRKNDHNRKPEMATDDLVMDRFRKRMRR